jgi:polynucleotide 5'-kinase involved in rRNA processing
MEELINVDILEDLLVASTKTIVCGAINTGKSTMCQTLVNRSIK